MSYWATIKTQIKDLPCLADACRELGCTLIMAPQQTAGAPRSQQVTHNGQSIYFSPTHAAAIMVPGNSCPIYVMKPQQGQPGAYSLSMETDYADHYRAKVGENCGRLLQAYGVHVTLKQAKLKGWAAQRVTLPNGTVNVILSTP